MWMWVTILEAEANQKLLPKYHDRRDIHFVLMNAEHELLKQLDLNTMAYKFLLVEVECT